MRKYLTVTAILLVLIVSACSPKPAAPTTAPTRALPTNTTAPATTEPTKAATSAVGSPAATSAVGSPAATSAASSPAATSSAGGTPAATSAAGTPSSSAGTGTPAASNGTPQVPITGALAAKISVANIPGLGNALVDATGMPLYMFKSDKQHGTNSACDLTCIQTWPPLITTAAPTAGEGVDVSMLGTITLPSGLVQVTYNGWPLYHYLPDASLPINRHGEASGQGFQGRWFVMGPDGNPISTLLPTATPTGTATAAP